MKAFQKTHKDLYKQPQNLNQDWCTKIKVEKKWFSLASNEQKIGKLEKEKVGEILSTKGNLRFFFVNLC